MLLDTLEADIECHILRALDLEFQLGRAVDGRTIAELRSAASEMAQICTEVANVVRRLQGISFKQPSGKAVLASVGQLDFAAHGKTFRAMTVDKKSRTAVRIRDFFAAVPVSGKCL